MYGSPKRSGLISALVHGVVFALLLATGGVVKILPPLVDHGSIVLPSDLVKYEVTRTESGSGAGGQNDPGPIRRGPLPKITPRPFVPPMVHIENTQPVLAMEMAILGEPRITVAAINLPVGDPHGVLDAIHGGAGGPIGIGDYGNGGIGKKDGSGYGDGDEPGAGGGRSGFREEATAPRLISKIEPEYSDEARKVKLQGTVLLRIVVDERGRAESIEVTRGLGLGLDERAVEAVKKWRFRPAMRGSRAVPASAIVEVTFRLL